MGLFLGLDSSTQSLSALLIDIDTGKVVLDRSVSFGNRLPGYQSPNGVLSHPDPAIKHADPLMWVEALDLLLEELARSGVELSRVVAISGAGQQHGSVYLNRSLDDVGAWSSSTPLHEQVRPLLSRATSPIWMDSSTSAACAEIAAAAGGDEEVARLSGSRATLRFTGPQIRRFSQTEPAAWEKTRQVHLVSSFIASLLIARSAPIDQGDGAGMNLLELATGDWSEVLLAATAPGLRRKLPPAVPSDTVIGELAGYFVERYGFSPGTKVVAFTGDNPSSLIGMGASEPGTAVVSLGTSDTLFTAMSRMVADPRGYGSVFGNPAGGFMSLVCFSNGSLAREAIATRFGLSWEDFARAILEQTEPGNGGNVLLPYFVPEITPRVLAAGARWFGSEAFVSGAQPAAAARAVVEAQALSMRLHGAWVGETMHTLLVTGGASRNPGLLRVLADVFQANILPLCVTNSSALGGALRAAHAVGGVSWERLYSAFCPPDRTRAVAPNPAARAAYDKLAAVFANHLNNL